MLSSFDQCAQRGAFFSTSQANFHRQLTDFALQLSDPAFVLGDAYLVVRR
jgi:hypothetical protein